MAEMETLPSRIRSALTQTPLRQLDSPVSGNAAVLLPILLVEPEPKLLLTRRTETVGSHKGQISFPGGMQDEADSDPIQTALRETSEELGINPDEFEILGQFHDYLSITNCRVRPVVGVRNGTPRLRPNRQEVARVLLIPLRFFLESEPRTEVRNRNGRDSIIYFYDYGEEVVWGLTAAIIHDFCGLLRNVPPQDEA